MFGGGGGGLRYTYRILYIFNQFDKRIRLINTGGNFRSKLNQTTSLNIKIKK